MRWINIKYELPPTEEYVLVSDCLGEYHVAKLTEKQDNNFYQESCLGEIFCIDVVKKVSDRNLLEFRTNDNKQFNITDLTHYLIIKQPLNV